MVAIAEARDPYDLSELKSGQKEGYYDDDVMAWRDANGGIHSQRCNGGKLVDGGHNPLPDKSDSY